MIWTPHATVATVVEQNGKLLMVEEHCHGKQVFNQPAGHIDENESIFDAAIRETEEETGWQVELLHMIGVYTYLAPENGVTYFRFCFAAKPIKKVSEQLDKGIIAAHWLSASELKELEPKMRSPLVLKCIDDYFNRSPVPLDHIYEHAQNA